MASPRQPFCPHQDLAAIRRGPAAFGSAGSDGGQADAFLTHGRALHVPDLEAEASLIPVNGDDAVVFRCIHRAQTIGARLVVLVRERHVQRRGGDLVKRVARHIIAAIKPGGVAVARDEHHAFRAALIDQAEQAVTFFLVWL